MVSGLEDVVFSETNLNAGCIRLYARVTFSNASESVTAKPKLTVIISPPLIVWFDELGELLMKLKETG